MDSAKQKEQYSYAFIHAAAAVAGFSSTTPPVDDDSIDWCVHGTGGGGSIRSPRLDMQVKSVSSPNFINDQLHYPLKAKNYADLIPNNVMVPRILVVVCIPAAVEEWQVLTHDHMLLRNSAYWVSLRGMAPSDNDYKVTVLLPKSQRFDGTALEEIMLRIANRNLP